VNAPLIRSAADALLAIALAPECAACKRVLAAPLDGPVCCDCWSAVRPGEYAGSLREIIHAFKYDGRRSLAKPLAAMMRASAADLLRDADIVVPVPLHAWRRLRRGFNQAGELARHLEVPICHALWRTRPTLPQTELGLAQRRRNVSGAFRLSPLVRRSRIEGARIVLVDDVRTTGSTLDACAEVLLAAGAEKVSVLTLARATLARHRF